MLKNGNDGTDPAMLNNATMLWNWRRGRAITHSVMHPMLGILGAAAGVGYEATASIMGAVGHATGQWAGMDMEQDDETEEPHFVTKSKKKTRRRNATRTPHTRK